MSEINIKQLGSHSNLKDPTPAEQQAAQDASDLTHYLQKIAALTQDYLNTGDSEDLQKIEEIVNCKMQPILADLQSISSQLPEGEVNSLIQLIPNLVSGTSIVSVIQFGLQLGIIQSQGTGPTNPTSADKQAQTDASNIYNLLFAGASPNNLCQELDQYLNASGPDKDKYLAQIENTLSSIQGYLTQLSQLPVSPELQSVIQELTQGLPTDPSSPCFVKDLEQFANNLGQLFGFFQ